MPRFGLTEAKKGRVCSNMLRFNICKIQSSLPVTSILILLKYIKLVHTLLAEAYKSRIFLVSN
jgi:hypothetical protein